MSIFDTGTFDLNRNDPQRTFESFREIVGQDVTWVSDDEDDDLEFGGYL